MNGEDEPEPLDPDAEFYDDDLEVAREAKKIKKACRQHLEDLRAGGGKYRDVRVAVPITRQVAA